MVVLTLAAAAAHAAPIADDYLKGYAAAILTREFKVRAPSLRVVGGTVLIHEADLATVDRSAVVTALQGIEGVSRVVILSQPASGATTVSPAPRASDAPAVDGTASISLLDTGWLPGGLLFRPLLADPRWPHFSLVYRRYLDEDDLGAVVAGTLGENLPVYRWTTSIGQWEVGGLALAAPIFDRDHKDDLVNTEFVLGLFAGWRRGELSGLLRFSHTSSHLGDELVLRSNIHRANLSFETVDARLSWDLNEQFRVYGGAGYRLRVDPKSLDRWSLQLGAEFRSAWRALQVLRPVAALDLQSRQENDWHPALSLRAGVQLDSLTVLGRSAQLLLEYYTGDSREGQFYTRDVEYLGVGLHFNF
jgi:Protein of unknown function (DUF1207)